MLKNEREMQKKLKKKNKKGSGESFPQTQYINIIIRISL